MTPEDKNNPYQRRNPPAVADDEGPFISEEVANKIIQESGRHYPRDTSKALWVVIGTGLVALAVGTALWLESTAKKEEDNSKYRSPASVGYSAPNPQKAHLSNGTPYKFYIVDNNVAVTELDGKPIIDSLEGKLGK